jgi:predicted deacylase
MKAHYLQEFLEKKMNKIEILRLESLSREAMVVEGYLFKGKNPNAPKIAIVGAMQGDAIVALHSAGAVVNFLKNTVKENKILGDILVIPSINHYGLNINEKFWPLDKTNLNMMFPGYNLGETTQRIASKIFEAIKDYDYGIVLETRSDQATCMPHVMLLQSGWEDLVGAKKFGFKIIHHKELESIDTVTLQYNWQLWETKAYSIVCPSSVSVDIEASNQILESIIRFMDQNKIIDYHIYNEYLSNILNKKNIKIIKAPDSGIFVPYSKPGDYVRKGDVIGSITDALTGEKTHRFKALCNGMITCIFSNALIIENAIAYRIAKIG